MGRHAKIAKRALSCQKTVPVFPKKKRAIHLAVWPCREHRRLQQPVRVVENGIKALKGDLGTAGGWLMRTVKPRRAQGIQPWTSPSTFLMIRCAATGHSPPAKATDRRRSGLFCAHTHILCRAGNLPDHRWKPKCCAWATISNGWRHVLWILGSGRTRPTATARDRTRSF